MTDRRSKASTPGGSSGLPLWPLWIGAATLMLIVHGTAGWALREWRAGESPPVTQEPSPIIIDLPPLAIAPEAPPQEATPAVEPEPAPDAPAETTQPQPPQTEQAQAIEPPPDAPLETTPPVQPETAQAEIAPPDPAPIPPPDIQPVTPEPAPDIPAQTERTQQAEVVMPAAKPKKKAAPRKTEKPQITKVGPDSPAPRAPQVARPAAPAGPSPSEVAAWRSAVSSRVARAAHTVTPRGNGTASVLISVSPSGQVGSVRIGRSSGNAQQDADLVAAIRNLGSVPTPPDGTKSATPLAIAVKFER